MGLLSLIVNFLLALFSAEFFKQFMAGLGMALVLVICIFPLAGCKPDMEPMERITSKALSEVIGPAVQKGIAELDSSGASLQGGMQAINPGYEVRVEGKMVTGFEGVGSVTAKGIAGQLQGSYSATKKDPAKTEGPTAPE